MNLGIFFSKYFSLIKEQSIYDFLSKSIKIIIVLILMYVAIKVGGEIISKWVKRQNELKFSLKDRKAKTVGAVLNSLLKYVVYFLGIFGIIEIMFGKIGLTFAGIGGVAVGFGAQNLVKDIINGFFILFEDQFGVGEYVNIGEKGGIVESVELRITKIRDFNGDLHIIPNGLITQVTNHSRGNSRMMIDVKIAYEENIDNAINVISNVCTKFKSQNNYVVEGPKVLGVTSLDDSSVTIKIMGKVKPLMQWEGEMTLRKLIKESFDSANIETPCPCLKIKGEESNDTGI